MISKIIQKEKARQKEILDSFPDIYDLDSGIHKGHWTHEDVLLAKSQSRKDEHKQSLINLKEYLEEEILWLSSRTISREILSRRFQLDADIKELNKMIKKYG